MLKRHFETLCKIHITTEIASTILILICRVQNQGTSGSLGSQGGLDCTMQTTLWPKFCQRTSPSRSNFRWPEVMDPEARQENTEVWLQGQQWSGWSQGVSKVTAWILHQECMGSFWAICCSHIVHVRNWMCVMQACNSHDHWTGSFIKRRKMACAGYLLASFGQI
jgi:hypothetical protein